jgi:phosphoserine phosphatase
LADAAIDREADRRDEGAEDIARPSRHTCSGEYPVTPRTPRYKSVALDVDSTLCGIEGIDWLAALRDDEVATKVADATGRAMRGEVLLEDMYGDRMHIVAPTRDEIASLSNAYRAALCPGAADEIAKWRASGVEVVLISAGLRAAIVPVAQELGFESRQINALDVEFDEEGVFTDFDRSSPLYSSTGKRKLIPQLALPRPLLAVGDGVSDLAMKEVADAFVAFTGFVTREAVTREADFVVSSFAQITQIIFGD